MQPGVQARLPDDYLVDARAHWRAVGAGDVTAKGMKGGVAMMTKKQNTLLGKQNRPNP
ncbi:MAG: hypothetical protein MUF81_07580 [Verrucomicrobia bacterium]|nr:hypothetical protein [Verrucomicrobiota bacterium]